MTPYDLIKRWVMVQVHVLWTYIGETPAWSYIWRTYTGIFGLDVPTVSVYEPTGLHLFQSQLVVFYAVK